MIKRAYVYFILAVLCVFSVLGTGFALWTFGEQSGGILDMGVRVTQSSVLGEFSSVPKLACVVLDGGKGSGMNPTITGVSFYKGEVENTSVAVTDTAFDIQFTVKEEFRPDINQNNNYELVAFGLRIDVPEKLKDIITHTDFYNNHADKDGFIDLKALVIELTDHFEGYGNSDFDYDKDKGVFTFKLTTTTLNRFFTYIPSEEPNTLEKYEVLGQNFAPYFVIELRQGYAETA